MDRRRFIFMGLTPAAALLGGCSIKQPYAVKQSFVLHAPHPSPLPAARNGKILRLRGVQSLPRFEGKGLVHRRGDLVYESDFYNEFFTSPRSLLGEQIKEWLANSGLFENVVDGSSQISATQVLESLVKSLYGDLRGEPKAVLSIEFTLLDYGKNRGTILFSRLYEAELPIPKRNAHELVKGWNQGLVEILQKFEQDLRVHARPR
jgi:cholesterol transport system auxiliary component